MALREAWEGRDNLDTLQEENTPKGVMFRPQEHSIPQPLQGRPSNLYAAWGSVKSVYGCI